MNEQTTLFQEGKTHGSKKLKNHCLLVNKIIYSEHYITNLIELYLKFLSFKI